MAPFPPQRQNIEPLSPGSTHGSSVCEMGLSVPFAGTPLVASPFMANGLPTTPRRHNQHCERNRNTTWECVVSRFIATGGPQRPSRHEWRHYESALRMSVWFATFIMATLRDCWGLAV